MSLVLMHITEAAFTVFHQDKFECFTDIESCIVRLQQISKSKELIVVLEAGSEQLNLESVPKLLPWEKSLFLQRKNLRVGTDQDVLSGEWLCKLSRFDGKRRHFKMQCSLSSSMDSGLKNTLESLNSAGFYFRGVHSGILAWYRSVSELLISKLSLGANVKTNSQSCWRIIHVKREAKVYQYLVCDSLLYQVRSIRYSKGCELRLIEDGRKLVSSLLSDKRFVAPVRLEWLAVGFDKEIIPNLTEALKGTFNNLAGADFTQPGFLTLPERLATYQSWIRLLAKGSDYRDNWLRMPFWLKRGRLSILSANVVMLGLLLFVSLQIAFWFDELNSTRIWQSKQLNEQRSQLTAWNLTDEKKRKIDHIDNLTELEMRFSGSQVEQVLQETFKLLEDTGVPAKLFSIQGLKFKRGENVSGKEEQLDKSIRIEVKGVIHQQSPIQVHADLQNFSADLKRSSRVSDIVWLQAPWRSELDNYYGGDRRDLSASFRMSFDLQVNP